MNTTKVSSKYQIVVPKNVRNIMKISPGITLRILPLDENKAVIIKNPKDYVKSLIGLGKEVWQKLGGGSKYIKSERYSWRKK
jgi:AbrB family looped-hinge helix DNA binding protein